jgi:hypothetical protein
MNASRNLSQMILPKAAPAPPKPTTGPARRRPTSTDATQSASNTQPRSKRSSDNAREPKDDFESFVRRACERDTQADRTNPDSEKTQAREYNNNKDARQVSDAAGEQLADPAEPARNTQQHETASPAGLELTFKAQADVVQVAEQVVVAPAATQAQAQGNVVAPQGVFVEVDPANQNPAGADAHATPALNTGLVEATAANVTPAPVQGFDAQPAAANLEAAADQPNAPQQGSAGPQPPVAGDTGVPSQTPPAVAAHNAARQAASTADQAQQQATAEPAPVAPQPSVDPASQGPQNPAASDPSPQTGLEGSQMSDASSTGQQEGDSTGRQSSQQAPQQQVQAPATPATTPHRPAAAPSAPVEESAGLDAPTGSTQPPSAESTPQPAVSDRGFEDVMQIMTQGQQTTATAGSTSTAASAAPAVSASPATASAEMAGDVSQVNVVHQVAQGVTGQAGLGRQVVVQLDPPELGSVRVTFQEDGQGLRGVLEVQHADTANQLQRETTELMNRLAAEGIQVRRLDVVVEPQSTGNSPSGSQTQSDTPAGRDASTGAQDFSSSSSDSQDRSGSSHESTGRSTSAPVADGSQDASDESLSPAASGQDGINLWM